MERKLNPELHIICGRCGNNNMLSFQLDPKGNCYPSGEEYPAVFISCNNCGTLSGLDEFVDDKTDWESIELPEKGEIEE
jgi:hypothetical protein